MKADIHRSFYKLLEHLSDNNVPKKLTAMNTVFNVVASIVFWYFGLLNPILNRIENMVSIKKSKLSSYVADMYVDVVASLCFRSLAGKLRTAFGL